MNDRPFLPVRTQRSQWKPINLWLGVWLLGPPQAFRPVKCISPRCLLSCTSLALKRALSRSGHGCRCPTHSLACCERPHRLRCSRLSFALFSCVPAIPDQSHPRLRRDRPGYPGKGPGGGTMPSPPSGQRKITACLFICPCWQFMISKLWRSLDQR